MLIIGCLFRKQRKNRGFRKQVKSESLRHLMHIVIEAEMLAGDGQKAISRDSRPYLNTHRVFRGSIEYFDPQVVLDPFEKQFDLPALLVKLGDDRRGQIDVVGEELVEIPGVGVAVLDPAEVRRIVLGRHGPGQSDHLIAEDSRGLVGLLGFNHVILGVVLEPGDEVGAGRREAVEPPVIDVPLVHEIERASLNGQAVQSHDIVRFACGNEDKGGHIAAKIDERVEFDGGFVASKLRPWKKGQTKADGGRVERVDHGVQIDADRLIDVQAARLGHEDLGKTLKDACIAGFIGVAKRGSTNVSSDAQMVKIGGLCGETGFDITETFAERQLSEDHREKVVIAGKSTVFIVPLVARHQRLKSPSW